MTVIVTRQLATLGTPKIGLRCLLWISVCVLSALLVYLWWPLGLVPFVVLMIYTVRKLKS